MFQKTITFVAANSWGNCQNEAFTSFIRGQSKQADVLGISEVFHTPSADLYQVSHENSWVQHLNNRELLTTDLSITAPDQFDSLYVPNSVNETRCCTKTKTVVAGSNFGNILFTRKGPVTRTGSNVIFAGIKNTDKSPSARNCQWAVVRRNGLNHLLLQFHGMWIEGNTKGNSPYRDQQSQSVIMLIDYLKILYNIDKVVFGGDFNLDIDTTALQLFVDAGYRNLNVELGHRNTRTELYREYNNPDASKYADYMFVSDTVNVVDFQVPNIPISDHRPLIIEFH
jgi:hypothetical protein